MLFWIIAAAVIVLVCALMWRYDRRHHVKVDPRTAESARGQGMGATYSRPPTNPPPTPPSGF